MKHLEALRKAVDDFLAEPLEKSKEGDPRRQLRAAVVFVRESLQLLDKQPKK